MLARTLLIAVVVVAGCARDSVGEPRATRAEPEQSASETPEEFGEVGWGRDLDKALVASRASGKPVLLLFTEVPGCSTVRGFANGALSHSLIVEAIEDEFEPVVVRNNVGGDERRILESFNEPTWNNPVVRFLDHNRQNLVPRYAAGWTEAGLAAAMVAALEAANRPVPGYLRQLLAEVSAKRQTTLFSMYCFWSGEVKFAGIDGVVSTRPGFANGHEVVEVVWDSSATDASELFAAASASGAASGVVLHDPTLQTEAQKHFSSVEALRAPMRFSAKDDKYQLRNRRVGKLEMTPAQATAVNRAVTTGRDLTELLSPRQMAELADDR